MKFVLRISGEGIKISDPLEDSNTGSPSSIIVTMADLFDFEF